MEGETHFHLHILAFRRTFMLLKFGIDNGKCRGEKELLYNAKQDCGKEESSTILKKSIVLPLMTLVK